MLLYNSQTFSREASIPFSYLTGSWLGESLGVALSGFRHSLRLRVKKIASGLDAVGLGEAVAAGMGRGQRLEKYKQPLQVLVTGVSGFGFCGFAR